MMGIKIEAGNGMGSLALWRIMLVMGVEGGRVEAGSIFYM